MNRRTIRCLSLMIVLTAFGVVGCKSRGTTLATVGGHKITESDLESLARVNPRLEAQIKSPTGRKKIVENYVDQLMMYLESKKRGLDDKKEVLEKINLYKKIITAQAVVDDEIEKASKEYYNNHRDEFERMKVSHILIRTVVDKPESGKPDSGKPKSPQKKEAAKKGKEPVVKRSEAEALKLAQAVKERLTKGEAFDQVVKSVSEDERTNKVAGSLGEITIRDKRLERWGWLPLAEQAFAMKEGDISDPIKSKDGYHILKVDKAKEVRPFEEAKGMIRFRIQEETQGKLLADLRKKYKPEYTQDKETAKKAPAAETQPTMPKPASPEPAPAQAAPSGATPESPPVAPPAP